jgi:broad-specificity NMP kinase
MNAFLITGRGGSGKTTICAELKRRGLPAFDADRVPGLAAAFDRNTGKPTTVDWSGYVDYSKFAWDWDDAVLQHLITEHPTLYLCGSASNQFNFHPLFTMVFVLQLDLSTHRDRLRHRESDYGRHPDMEAHLLQEQQSFAAEAIRRGGIPLDATLPLPKLVDEILRLTRERSR